MFFIDIATMCDMQRIAHRVSITNDHTLNSRMKGNLPVRLGAAVRGAIPLSTVTIQVEITHSLSAYMLIFKIKGYVAGLHLKI